MPLGDRLLWVWESLQPRRRRVWTTDTRAHIEIRDLTVHEREAFADAIEVAFAGERGVRWVRVNGYLNRVIVAHEANVDAKYRFVHLVEQVERELGHARRPYAEDRAVHPGDVEPMARAVVEVAADCAALVVGTVAKALRIPAANNTDVAIFLTLINGIPAARKTVEKRLGAATADLVMGLIGATIQGSSQARIGPSVDLLHRSLRLRETMARHEAWRRREPDLCASPDAHFVGDSGVGGRPRPLPDGPVETYTERVVLTSLAFFGFSLATTHDLESSAASLFTGIPKPARLGPAAAVSTLGRLLALNDILVLHHQALRTLDRVDTMVVSGHLLDPTGEAVGVVLPLGDEEPGPLRRVATELFDHRDPDAVQVRDQWQLGRPSALDVELGDSAGARARNLERPGGHVLVLLRAREPVALVATRPVPDPAARAFVDRCRGLGLRLVVATEDVQRTAWAEPDEVLPGGLGVGHAIRGLQAEGAVVAFVESGPSSGFQAADVGIGLTAEGVPPPWRADFLCGSRLEDGLLLLEVADAMRKVAQQSVDISVVEAGVGFLLAHGGLRMRKPRRFIMASNVAALVAMVNAIRVVSAIRPPRPGELQSLTPWHALEPAVALGRLRSEWSGLSSEEADNRRRPERTQRVALRPDFVGSLLDELGSPLAPVLLGGAGLSALLGRFIDAGMILSVVGFNALVSAVHRQRTEAALAAIQERKRGRVRVVRDGELAVLDQDELVLGDVVIVGAGEVVAADCRLLEADQLEVDESTLTGESFPVFKSVLPSRAAALADRTSMLFEGTTVVAGRGRAVVTAVGSATEGRRSMYELEGTAPRGGVEARLESLTSLTVPVALAGGLSVLASNMVRGRPSTSAVSSAVSLAVAAIPEGLPLLATMAQMAAASRLSEFGALVRNQRAVEALGRMDVLCADKTGTLTEGHIRLLRVSDGRTDVPAQRLRGALAGAEPELEPMLEVVAAALRATPRVDAPSGHRQMTDRAVAEGAHDLGMDRTFRVQRWRPVETLPFKSRRGYHAVLGEAVGREPGSAAARLELVVKGAPEVVLARCRRWRGGELLAEVRDELSVEYNQLAARGLRVLAVAMREWDEPVRELADGDVADLELLGFVGLADSVRPTAADALRDLERAGVRTIMITGDHPVTAQAIGRELGLPSSRVLSGPELELYDDDQLAAILDEVNVFARVAPQQKVRLVRALQQSGRIVGMTGDGANDAQAIRLADVGIALGEDATAAARQAADVVVLDGRIETIVRAVLEGRGMWRSLRDAVSLLVGGNLGEIGFSLVGALATGDAPLGARQLLLVNLVTDALPAFAVALRPPDADPDELLDEGPEASLGESLDRDIAWRAMVTSGATLLTWTAARWTQPTRRRADTVGLLTLVGSQLAQTVVAGKGDRTVTLAGVGSMAALIAVVQTPGLSRLVGCRPLGPVGLAQVASGVAAAGLVGYLSPRILGEERRDADSGPGLPSFGQRLGRAVTGARDFIGQQMRHLDWRQ